MATDIQLNDNAYAIVWDPEQGWDLFIPHLDEANSTLEETGAALVAAFMRLNSDPDFVADNLNWLEAQAQEINEPSGNTGS